MSSEQESAKVLFRVPQEDGSAMVETLWADALGNDKFQLDNSPFYAYSVSWEDVVYAPFDEDEKFHTFQKVEKKSGNRTIRLIFEEEVLDDNEFLNELVNMGCSYEGLKRKYFSINIPSEINLQDIREFLIEKELDWEHADPTYKELFPDET